MTPDYAGGVIEYMICHERHVDGFLEPSIQADRVQEVFRPPPGSDCKTTDLWHLLMCGDTRVEISLEGVGIQVSFDGPIDAGDAGELVDAFLGAIQQEVDEPVVAVQTSW